MKKKNKGRKFEDKVKNTIKDTLLYIIDEPHQIIYAWLNRPLQIIKKRVRNQYGRFC